MFACWSRANRPNQLYNLLARNQDCQREVEEQAGEGEVASGGGLSGAHGTLNSPQVGDVSVVPCGFGDGVGWAGLGFLGCSLHWGLADKLVHRYITHTIATANQSPSPSSNSYAHTLIHLTAIYT